MIPSKEIFTEEKWTRIRLAAVARQLIDRGIKDRRVLEAMRQVPRHLFLPPETTTALAYADRPLPIGFNQTISQPYIVAYLAEKLELTGKEIVLEIGTGSGYQAAVLAKLAKEIFSLEIIPELAQFARENLGRLNIANVEITVSDGYLGWIQNAPFDRIVLTAYAQDVPAELLRQLNAPGKLIAPIGTKTQQRLVLWEKIPNPKETPALQKTELISVMFVPMKGQIEQ